MPSRRELLIGSPTGLTQIRVVRHFLHCYFLRCRRRNALSALPFSGYAVITKMPAPTRVGRINDLDTASGFRLAGLHFASRDHLDRPAPACAALAPLPPRS